MTEESQQTEEFVLPPESSSYIGERNYKVREYKPYKECLSDLCKSCKDYYKDLYKKGLTKKEFPVQCTGHIFDAIEGLQEDDFDEKEEYEDILTTIDPVSWAMKYFGWEARWYQEELSSCSAQKKVVRAGRRVGKTTTIVMLIAWMLYTRKDFSILAIAPYQAQVTKIFDEVIKLISLNEELSGSVKRNTKNPARLELNNGSKILGFSSGAQSSSKSDKIRGQDANFIVLDEADYLADDDLDAILAILASHPDCGLWVSSTPTGKHNKYYMWSTIKDLGFKEFHYVSAESPSWTDDVDDFYKRTYNRATYEHEFLAEFGIQEKGVFRNDLLDASIREYEIPKAKKDNSRVVIGVDWNGSDIGVHITVVEFNGENYVLLAKEIIKAGEFTQHAAIDGIMELDKKYKSDYIYVDAGYGSVQVEMMHKIGLKDPSTKWHTKIKPYAFGAKIEVRDPRTGAVVKKAAKPFLVNITTLQLEQGRLILPKSEDTQVVLDDTEEGGIQQGLIQQMRNFEVLRYSSTGLPTYSQGEEHTLIAYMLSIVGFVLEFSDIRQIRSVMGMVFTGPISNQETNSSETSNRAVPLPRGLDTGITTSDVKKDMSAVLFAQIARKKVSKVNRSNLRTTHTDRTSFLNKNNRKSF